MRKFIFSNRCHDVYVDSIVGLVLRNIPFTHILALKEWKVVGMSFIEAQDSITSWSWSALSILQKPNCAEKPNSHEMLLHSCLNLLVLIYFCNIGSHFQDGFSQRLRFHICLAHTAHA